MSTFGSTTKQADKPSEQQIDENNYYIAETEVTAVMDKQGWTVEKDLEAKMTYSMVGNLPQPVVIVPGRRVILSPKEKEISAASTWMALTACQFQADPLTF